MARAEEHPTNIRGEAVADSSLSIEVLWQRAPVYPHRTALSICEQLATPHVTSSTAASEIHSHPGMGVKGATGQFDGMFTGGLLFAGCVNGGNGRLCTRAQRHPVSNVRATLRRVNHAVHACQDAFGIARACACVCVVVGPHTQTAFRGPRNACSCTTL